VTLRPSSGVAFTLAEDGDVRADHEARRRVSALLGISPEWATVGQVHGAKVLEVTSPGRAGEADALVTRLPGLPLAVFTADCLGVVVTGGGGVGVAHAGWRGMADDIVVRLVEFMVDVGIEPRSAHIGPGIGPCCFEVGPEVAERFPDEAATTTWDTMSVDLVAGAVRRLAPLPVWVSGRCTRHEAGHHSHRADATTSRMAAIGWLPNED
jgi:polyphenol oxidase